MLKFLAFLTFMLIGECCTDDGTWNYWSDLNKYFATKGESCDSCGNECVPACGTRQFKTCCYNYLKKRSGSVLEEPRRSYNELPRYSDLQGPAHRRPHTKSYDPEMQTYFYTNQPSYVEPLALEEIAVPLPYNF